MEHKFYQALKKEEKYVVEFIKEIAGNTIVIKDDSSNYTAGVDLCNKVMAAKYMTIFVLDQCGRMIGVITEGDVIACRNMSSIVITDVMNSNPKFVEIKSSEQDAVKCFDEHKSIRAVPVIDCDGKLVSIIARYKERKYSLPFPMEVVDSVFQESGISKNWHYRAYDSNWGGTLDARRFIIGYIEENFCKETRVLDIACGTGLMCFYLAEQGFVNLHGFDFDNSLISAAQKLSKHNNYNIKFWIDDAFSPSIDVEGFDVAIFLGLVGCDWGFLKEFDESTPTHIMIDYLFNIYKFKKGTIIFLDVYDDLSNYSLDKMKPAYRTVKYEDLLPVFSKHGYEIIDKCFDTDYRVKVIYVLRATH